MLKKSSDFLHSYEYQRAASRGKGSAPCDRISSELSVRSEGSESIAPSAKDKREAAECVVRRRALG